jgi:hypothetical protein
MYIPHKRSLHQITLIVVPYAATIRDDVAGSLALDYKDILAGKNVWLMGRWVSFNNSKLEMCSSGLTLCADGHISRD